MFGKVPVAQQDQQKLICTRNFNQFIEGTKNNNKLKTMIRLGSHEQEKKTYQQIANRKKQRERQRQKEQQKHFSRTFDIY